MQNQSGYVERGCKQGLVLAECWAEEEYQHPLHSMVLAQPRIEQADSHFGIEADLLAPFEGHHQLDPPQLQLLQLAPSVIPKEQFEEHRQFGLFPHLSLHLPIPSQLSAPPQE